jgi:hypothetical protein
VGEGAALALGVGGISVSFVAVEERVSDCVQGAIFGDAGDCDHCKGEISKGGER